MLSTNFVGLSSTQRTALKPWGGGGDVKVCFFALVVCCAACTAAQHYRAAIALSW